MLIIKNKFTILRERGSRNDYIFWCFYDVTLYSHITKTVELVYLIQTPALSLTAMEEP